jgi:hypothetical protein
MPTQQIRIDATPLFFRSFIVPTVTPDWMDANQVQTLSLHADASYSIQTFSGIYCDFTFQITADGTVAYADDVAHFLSGRGTRTLTLNGMPVTIDARYLSGAGVLISEMPHTGDDFISFETVRLLPCARYLWQQGSGQKVDFACALRRDGTWVYDPKYDLSRAGYITGNASPILQFYGFPLLVDMRQAGGTGVLVDPISGLQFTGTSVQYVNLLPADRFTLQIRSGQVTSTGFTVDNKGVVIPDPATPLTVDRFNGVPRLRATGPL